MLPPDLPTSKAGALVGALEWLFDRVAHATTPTNPASNRDIDRMIAMACTGAGAAGFVTNMGGLLNQVLPPDLPTSKAGALVGALEWLFDRVAHATTPTNPASNRDIDRMIAMACTGAGAAGFVTNMGGLITLPIALPANLLGVATIQLRLIASIAAARGHDVNSDQVRTLAIACLTGGAALDLLKDAGIQVGRRLGERAIGHLAAPTLARINEKVGFQLVAKAGSQGAVNLTKFIPLLGGLVGGAFDAASTRAIGAIAKRVFAPIPPPLPAIHHAQDLIA